MANGGLILDYILKGVGAPSAYSFPGGGAGVPSLGANATEVGLYLNTTNNHLYAWDGAAWQDTTGTGGGGGSLTSLKAALSANVAIAAGVYSDGPSLSLAAGTWDLIATVSLQDSSFADNFVAQLWDGTTAVASGAGSSAAAGNIVTITLTGIVTISSTTTYKISAKALAASNILASVGVNNTASVITAKKIA